MEIGFIGLGKMGGNMVKRLLTDNHKVVVWDISDDAIKEIEKKGAVGASSIEGLAGKLRNSPRIVWIMVPSGKATEESINKVASALSEGDIIIDGGNSNFSDSMNRSEKLKEYGIKFIDIGTSGGLAGATEGYCMMVGGEKETYKYIIPILGSLCIKEGYSYMGKSGSGHYVKMVHNAIEYGMMQAIVEGFDLLSKGSFDDLNLKDISHVWNHGSIVRSFLMEMAESALSKDPKLESLAPFVSDSGEGRWAAVDAMKNSVPFTVNTFALHSRYISRDEKSMAFRMLAALRNEFGGHSVKKEV